jgi:uncharacterized protein (DUF2384 family)
MRPKTERPAASARWKSSVAAAPGKAKKSAVARPARVKQVKQKPGVSVHSFRTMLRTAPLIKRVLIERDGVPHQVVQGLIKEIGVSSSDFQRYVRIPKATFTKKMKDKSLFAGTTGQSMVGLMDLINKVEDMLAAEKDNPKAQHFDVQKWVGHWIERPQPALGGLAPAEMMDTPTGRESVMKVLGAIQSGAYQ